MDIFNRCKFVFFINKIKYEIMKKYVIYIGAT